MLSQRGQESAASQEIPWRFAPGGNDLYDKLSNPTGVVSFGTAENALMHTELSDFVEKSVTIPSEAFTYRFSTMGGARFSNAMAAHINAYFSPHIPIQPHQILTAAGLTAIHEMVALSIGDPGDGILVTRPIYGRFELDFGNTAGLKIVYADMEGVDPFVEGVVGRYEAALEKARDEGARIRAILIVNPHNPLGRCYPPSTLRGVMALCNKYSIHLISDEVYALSVFGKTGPDVSPGFTSVLSINPDNIIDLNLLHVFYGMSKDFAAAGLRLGSLITSNSSLRQAVAANFRFHSPSGMSIAIATAMLEDQEWVASFIALSRERLRNAYKFTTGKLREGGIEWHGGSNAGFFLYINLGPWLPSVSELSANSDPEHEQEYALAQVLLDVGVGLHPCEEHEEAKGWFRLVFSQEREMLCEGLKRSVRLIAEIYQGVEADSWNLEDYAKSFVP